MNIPSVTGLPPTAIQEDGPGTFVCTWVINPYGLPNTNSGSSYRIKITATDRNGNSGTALARLRVDAQPPQEIYLYPAYWFDDDPVPTPSPAPEPAPAWQPPVIYVPLSSEEDEAGGGANSGTTGEETADKGELVYYTLESTNYLPGDVSCRLSFGDGYILQGETYVDANGTPKSGQAGTYTVCFTVSDSDRAVDSKLVTITVKKKTAANKNQQSTGVTMGQALNPLGIQWPNVPVVTVAKYR